MSNFAYLSVDLMAISIPLILSFNFIGKFYKEWKAVFLAIFITGFFFIIWDIPFTKYGIWGFNDEYLLGLRIFGLPIEEYLFFICIPYACLFTYHQLKVRKIPNSLQKYFRIISYFIIILLIILSILYFDKVYTITIYSFTIPFLFFCLFSKNKEYLGLFYLSYLIIILPFLITNGILTGFITENPIVWYNNSEIIGLRIGTIPFEDFSYYLLMFLMNVVLYEKFSEHKPNLTD